MARPALPPSWAWAVLYVPFGALSGFVSIALAFRATESGMSISEGALIGAAQLLCQWLKWIWAPAVDVTLSPRKWYIISTILSATGVLVMSAIPLNRGNLPLLLAIIATASFVNTVVGMSVEALMSESIPEEEVGNASGWFQAGNLGGGSFGGGLGLLLIKKFPERPWIAGIVCGGTFIACGLAMLFVPRKVHTTHKSVATEARPTALQAMKSVIKDLKGMLSQRGGKLAAFLCMLPLGTGNAQDTLVQAAVAKQWGANENHVAWLQGALAGLIKILGCFAGGYLCKRIKPQSGYTVGGIILAALAIGMALSPYSLASYIGWNIAYSFGVGMAYSAFTAVALSAMGDGSGATKYSIFASLSNFPIWWLGYLLGVVADKRGPKWMLLTEAGLGVVATVLFVIVSSSSKQTPLKPLETSKV
jgi:MFS transporter, PAT family, beta-lactamase induction signal transducer AmpG